MKDLKHISLRQIVLENGKTIAGLPLTYQHFGQEIGTAPVIVVNHALTGNSNVTDWWSDLIGENKTIDTKSFTVIAFNIPGNGYDDNPENLIGNYRDFTARDIAAFFWKGLEQLSIHSVFAVIGGSLGGGIAWEMAALEPTKINNLIPIATDWKATDWVIANVLIQDKILTNSDDPVSDARLHAMLLYRTPLSLLNRFNRKKSADTFKVENWLLDHGQKLKDRFRLSSYKLMNNLLKTVDITRNRGSFKEIASKITANIHLIAVDSDLFYIPEENIDTLEILRPYKSNVFYHEIESIHGHDAFLIEHRQLSDILETIFSRLGKTISHNN
ncbi:alpha/beta fold hydrolase [Flavobacterium silvaticum]|uniref:Alpha/beta fold hydrolase n=1 Tax=Flavobacterium silvaticum TaxID=1852020 RepID=A0A972FL43_9FLAO|nr:alpha/beta fold hydrolase [Flavobacterium silvaticum]NMH27235.1 alpha/beta fold hydrolase [Flavobacterium silvaticum]